MPPTAFFRTSRETAAAIIRLESELGLPPSQPIFNIGRAKKRLEELESLATKNPAFVESAESAVLLGRAARLSVGNVPRNPPQAAKTPAAPKKLSATERCLAAAPASALPAAITFAEWRSMSADDQRSFCRDGGKMHRDEFMNKMPMAAQSHFLACGGQLESPAPPAAVPKTKTPSANSMFRDVFLALTPQEQTAHFAAGKKVHD